MWCVISYTGAKEKNRKHATARRLFFISMHSEWVCIQFLLDIGTCMKNHVNSSAEPLFPRRLNISESHVTRLRMESMCFPAETALFIHQSLHSWNERVCLCVQPVDSDVAHITVVLRSAKVLEWPQTLQHEPSSAHSRDTPLSTLPLSLPHAFTLNTITCSSQEIGIIKTDTPPCRRGRAMTNC